MKKSLHTSGILSLLAIFFAACNNYTEEIPDQEQEKSICLSVFIPKFIFVVDAS
jgi:hypothetical protein